MFRLTRSINRYLSGTKKITPEKSKKHRFDIENERWVPEKKTSDECIIYTVRRVKLKKKSNNKIVPEPQPNK